MSTPNTLRAMHSSHKGEMTKTNLFMADLDLLVEEEGFNPRDYEDPEVVSHIRMLADAYKRGDELPPLRVQVRDGAIFLRDGHCRRRGAVMARDEGAEISRLPVMEVRGDETDQNLVILTSNEGLKLSPLERAVVYTRFITLGMSEEELAQKVNKSQAHVSQYLAVHNLPIAMKQAIKENRIAWTYALELYNEHGTKAIEMINGAVADKAAETGNSEEPEKKPRVTRKSIDAQNGFRSSFPKPLIKNVTSRMKSLIEHLNCSDTDGDFMVVRIPMSEVDELRKLHESIVPQSAE